MSWFVLPIFQRFLPSKGLRCTEPQGHIKFNSMPLKMDIPVEVDRLKTIICRVIYIHIYIYIYPRWLGMGFLKHQQHLKMDWKTILSFLGFKVTFEGKTRCSTSGGYPRNYPLEDQKIPICNSKIHLQRG